MGSVSCFSVSISLGIFSASWCFDDFSSCLEQTTNTTITHSTRMIP